MISQKMQVGAALSADRTRPAGVDGEFLTVENSTPEVACGWPCLTGRELLPGTANVPRELCLQPDTNCNDHSFRRGTDLHFKSAEAGHERAAAMSRG